MPIRDFPHVTILIGANVMHASLLILACHSTSYCMSGFSESMQDASQLLHATVQREKGYRSVNIDGRKRG